MSNPRVSLSESFKVWSKVALLSFGGPAGQIAVMHRILVEEKKWVSEARFLHALNYCMLLPGPEAQQLATYIGWLMHRTIGGLMAGLLFILPGFISILALSILYALYKEVHFIDALFFGLKPAVMAIVASAVLRIGSKTLKTGALRLIAVLSFVALFFFSVPFPIVIASAALIGFLGGRKWPQQFDRPPDHHGAAPAEQVMTDPVEAPRVGQSFFVLAVFAILWWLPVALLYFYLGPQNVFYQEALFFSKASLVTFGGAYAVLAYIGQQAVESYGWLAPREMLDGLGMAETTPGPLIQVVQFVGFMGAFRAAEANLISMSPLMAGITGSVVTTWVTFVPCFLWIFLGAPYIERLRNQAGLSRALSAITAAVVGVILNLAIWFSLHVIFREVDDKTIGPFRLLIPDFETLEPKLLALALLAFVFTFWFKWNVMKVIGASVAIGIPLYYLF